MQPLLTKAWQELYPGIIEWKSPSSGGNAASIDVAKKTIETDFDTYQYAVANVIPPQKAGRSRRWRAWPITPAGVRSIR